jgi:hypothetical protein
MTTINIIIVIITTIVVVQFRQQRRAFRSVPGGCGTFPTRKCRSILPFGRV